MSDALPVETPPPPPARRGKGGRPKIDPAAVRRSTIGVRVSAAESATLRTRAAEMGLTPAQFLRHTALTRRLPRPPVPAVNRDEYAKLGRLAGNLNQLVRRANLGQHVILTRSAGEAAAGRTQRPAPSPARHPRRHPMIAKAVKGASFKGAVSYDLDPEKGALLDTNMAGETPLNSRPSSRAIRDLRPGVTKAVLHVSLSAAPGEQLSDEQWRDIGQQFRAGMDLDHNQYVLTRHTDTAHDHIHLVANRIDCEGQVVSDSHDYQRMHTLMREIERDYGLQEVPSQPAERHAPTKGELERTLRTGEPSTRPQLQVPVRRRRPGLRQLHRLPGTSRRRRRRDHPHRAAAGCKAVPGSNTAWTA